MSALKPRLNELVSEIESCVLDISGRIDTTLKTIEDFVPTVLNALDIIEPEIKSVQAELGAQIEKLKGDIDHLAH